MPRRSHGRSWKPVVAARAARRRGFEELVAEALDALPEEIQAWMDNVEVVIEDGESPEALGLYRGIPHTERGAGYSGVLPDVITIYRGSLEARARDAEDLAREVRKTVWHEVAHHFGIDDDRLRELGME